MISIRKTLVAGLLGLAVWGVIVGASPSTFPGDDPEVGGGGNISHASTSTSTAINVLGARQVALIMTATNTVKCSVFVWQVSNDSTNWTASTAYANQVTVKSDSVVDARLDLGGRSTSLLPASGTHYIPFRWARVVATPYRADDQVMTGVAHRSFVLRDIEVPTPHFQK